MRRFLTPACTVFLSCILAIAAISPADAAPPRFTRTLLTIAVTGHTAHATVKVKASRTTTVEQYGICVRNARRTVLDFHPKARHRKITRSGTSYTATTVLANGQYTVWACLRYQGHWVRAGSIRHITVDVAKASPTPTPVSTPTPIPTPVPTSTPSPMPTEKPELLFVDEFDGSPGSDYDHEKWGEWSGCTYRPSAYYGNIKCGDRATLDGEGHLSIPATPAVGTSLSTKGNFSFTYGTITARIKIPTQVGYWPALWTLNNNPSGNPLSPLVGELDVMESYTTWDHYHRGAHHYNNVDPSLNWTTRDDPLCGSDLRGVWHEYSAKIEPGRITFYFDGHECGRAAVSSEGNGKPYGFVPDNMSGNWIILSLAIGGADGHQLDATIPAALLVDRVEVRALSPGSWPRVS